MNPKPFLIFFSASLACHVVVVSSFYSGILMSQGEPEGKVTISYIHPAPSEISTLAPKPAALAEPPAPKPIDHGPVKTVALEKPRLALKSLPAKPASASVDKTAARSFPAKASAPNQAAVPRSTDLLADPKKGRRFATYFSKVKARIHQTVQRRYSYQNVGSGSVTLLFILNSRGELEAISVMEKQSSTDEVVKDFAASCVRASAPFPPFPKDFLMDRISFNITLVFEETD